MTLEDETVTGEACGKGYTKRNLGDSKDAWMDGNSKNAEGGILPS